MGNIEEYTVKDAAAAGTPIAAASSRSYYTIDSAGSPASIWVKLLSVSATGLEVETASIVTGDRFIHDEQRLSLANSTENPKTFGALAITNIGKAFAIVTTPDQKRIIQSWQFLDDLVSWDYTGLVDIGNAWD